MHPDNIAVDLGISPCGDMRIWGEYGDGKGEDGEEIGEV